MWSSLSYMSMFTYWYTLVKFSKMFLLKTTENEMKVIRAVKYQAVILYTGLLNTLVFSSTVGSSVGGIYCEEGLSPLFKKLNCVNSNKKWRSAGLFLLQFFTLLNVVCRKICCTITAYWSTCTYSILYSFSYIREQFVGGLWVSLKFFAFTISIKRAKFL